MVTDRKKRKKRLFLTLYSGIFLFILCGVGGYAVFLSLTQGSYVSPLPLALSKIGIGTSTSNTKSVEASLKNKKIAYTSVFRDSSTSYLVQLPHDGEVLLSSTKNVDEQVASLQLILSRLTIEGKGLRRLDLRFDKPVIVLR